MSWFEKIEDLKAQSKMYIVAELGSNYRDYNDLINSVSFAKKVGADAVKFQYYDKSELFGPVEHIDPVNHMPQLFEKAKAVGIDLLCSAFSPKGLKAIDQYVPAHKIASSEMCHIRLLEAAMKTGKPIILSTGGYHVNDIKAVLKFIGDYPVVLLHCNLAYPAKFVDRDKFRQITEFYKGPIGFSDHTTNIDLIPAMFKKAGCVFYEKHWNPYELTDTPDAGHALTNKEFQFMVSHLRTDSGVFTEENDARIYHVRRVVALKDLAPGVVLKEGVNMGIFRSKAGDHKGMNPLNISKLEGKMTGKSLIAGEGISMVDVVK